MDLSTQKIMDSFRRITRALRNASRHSESKLGISIAQLFVLRQIKKGEPLSLNQLAELTYSHQSTVSVIVDDLVKKEYILRTTSIEDRRRIVLQLSPSGSALLRKKQKTIQEQFTDSIERIPLEDRKKLALLLETFITNAGLSSETPDFFFENEEKKTSKESKR